MDRNGILAVSVLILIVVTGSDASLIGRFRKLVAENSNLTEITPSPSPSSDVKYRNETLPTQTTEKVGDESQPAGSRNGKCDVSHRCMDRKKLIACLAHPEDGSQDLFLLVENEGESTLKVSITVPPTVNIGGLKEIEVPEHKPKWINFSASAESAKIVLNAGNGDCVLHMGPQSEDNIVKRLYAQASHISFTPIYGAYVLFLVTLIVGGTWACCKLVRKGRQHSDGVPYQELEMAQPEGVSDLRVNTADGWDEDWDDDWDEEKAIKSEVINTANVSANGLTARSPNKNGWESDWND